MTTCRLRAKETGLLSAGICLFILFPVFGEDTHARLAALEARIAELEKRLEEQNAALRLALDTHQAGHTANGPNSEMAAFSNRLTTVETHLATMRESGETPWPDGLSLGGYGEVHYSNLSGQGGAADKREIDFHRFVLMLGKTFSERIRFNSELELEHVMAGDNEKGHIALEQAYFDFDMNDSHTLRAGLFLMPVGLLNAAHEPTRFYGVERNPVEREVIPSTWWEAGIGSHGWFNDSLEYAAYLHSGLKTDRAKNYAVRSGRQKVANADASEPAGTLALNWHRPGFTLGGSLQYQSDITQGAELESVPGVFSEGHLIWQHERFALRKRPAKHIGMGAGSAADG
nr:porin [Kiritimatiellia bacterium]